MKALRIKLGALIQILISASFKNIYRSHLHEGKECPVCDNIVDAKRYSELGEHFSTEAQDLEEELDLLKDKWKLLSDAIAIPPAEGDVNEAYYKEDVWNNYIPSKKNLEFFINKVNLAIDSKIKDIEHPLDHDIQLNEQIQSYRGFCECFSKIDEIIKRHNIFCKGQETIKEQAEEALKLDVAVNNKELYKELKDKKEQKEKELEDYKAELDKLPQEIKSIKAKISKISPSKKNINKHLRGYLGHDKLQLGMEDGSYFIMRGKDKSSAPLSEGEKTALAFCYFITSLNKTNLKNTIIVVDDPISSLDSRYLHYAFNFMKEKTRDAEQVFILTHNFYFFKACKKNIGHDGKWKKKKGSESLKEKTSANRTMLFLTKRNDISYLEQLPKTLKKHESEYHYFVSLLFDAINDDQSEPDCYGLANACRRVLETFLHFKYPNNGKSINDKFETVLKNIPESDEGDYIKFKANERLVQVESHSDNIDKLLGLEDATLASVKDTVKFILEFIKGSDPVHYEALEKAVKN